jgi:hypothetical protein
VADGGDRVFDLRPVGVAEQAQVGLDATDQVAQLVDLLCGRGTAPTNPGSSYPRTATNRPPRPPSPTSRPTGFDDNPSSEA